MSPEFRIPSPNIVLRDWQLADLPAYAYWLEPGHEWKNLDAPYYPGPDLAEIPEYIERKQRLILGATLPEPRTNVVIARADTDALIGAVNCYWESIETLWLTLGIVVYDPRYWGHGVGFAAMGMWAGYQFRSRPAIVRLDLRTWSGNYGMIRVAHKLGFQQEACFRKARIVADEYYDSLAYGILREEWQQLYPDGFTAA
ncbi:MAG: GNAT family N-acetyltransferase [Herpetosiphonaceae bacterium]|nr:GNAT family N-acetyltransferase [Herpetosiphonaceae bacterium]